ncbi:MAG: hypothetical protein GY786_19275 [Proteobacteria bacterium]|nr:hypothetical protein [Pseudomonadota bacterium]
MESPVSLDIIKVFASERQLSKYSDPNRLTNEGVPFIGQPKKHPTDPDKIFIRTDPLAKQGHLLEFKTADVIFAEEINTIAGSQGSAINIHKVWVRKGSIGIKLEAFSVMDFTNAYNDHLKV